MRTPLSLLTLTGLLLLTVSLTACSSEKSADTIRIGYIGPLTGDAAAYGSDTLNGSLLRILEEDPLQGIKGRKIKLIAEDGGCSGAGAASAAARLIEVEKVVAILGGQCSAETLAVAPIATQASVPIISAISSNPSISEEGKYVFRTYPSDALKTVVMANYLADQSLNRIAIISESEDFTVGFRDSFLGDARGEIVFNETVPGGTKDFRTLLTRLSREDFNVLVANGNSPAAIAAMTQQMRDLGMTQTIISHDLADSQVLLEIAPVAAEGLLAINTPPSGAGTAFEEHFVEKFDEPQQSLAFAVHAYDAADALLTAIEAVGTGGDAIADYLLEQEFDGIIGTFSFDENGDVLGASYTLREVQNGQFRDKESLPIR